MVVTLCTKNEQLGDELYEAEFYEELPQGSTIEKEIEFIVLQLLREFCFLKDDEEYHDDDDEDNECGKEKTPTQNTYNVKSNYFQKQLRMMATKYEVAKGGKDDDEGDDMSDVTAKVFSHSTLTEISNTMDDRRL